MDSTTPTNIRSNVRTNFVARQLVYWIGKLGEGNLETGYRIDWYPEYYLQFSHRCIHKVDRLALKQVAVALISIAPETNIQFFHLTGIWFALEGLELWEQRKIPAILKENYGIAN